MVLSWMDVLRATCSHNASNIPCFHNRLESIQNHPGFAHLAHGSGHTPDAMPSSSKSYNTTNESNHCEFTISWCEEVLEGQEKTPRDPKCHTHLCEGRCPEQQSIRLSETRVSVRTPTGVSTQIYSYGQHSYGLYSYGLADSGVCEKTRASV